MELFIVNQVFDKQQQELLTQFQDETMYVSHMNSYEKGKYASFQIVWLMMDTQIIGYALLGKVTAPFFEGDEDGEEIIEVMERGKEYYYIPYFEVFEHYQGKGIGTTFWNCIREKIGDDSCIVYCTEDSEEFWFKVGFESANYSDWWLQYTAS